MDEIKEKKILYHMIISIETDLVEYLSDFVDQNDFTEKMLVRASTGLALLVIVDSGFSITLGNQLNQKMLEAKEVDDDVIRQLTAVRNDIKQIETKADRYATLVANLENVVFYHNYFVWCFIVLCFNAYLCKCLKF